MKVKAVIFDLDGVITDTAMYHYLAWKKLSDDIGVSFDEEKNEALKGLDRRKSFEEIIRGSDKKFSEEEKNEFIERKNDYYKELISNMTEKDILPGTIDLIKKLREMGIKIGLASVSKNAFSVLEYLKIGELFDYVVDAEKLKNTKPDPEIFLTAADNLNVPYEYCIGVEDSAAGITSINDAGMYSVGVGSEKTLKYANEVIPDLTKFDISKLLNM